MAFKTPRAIDIEIVDAETGLACDRPIQMHFLNIRWEAARHIESLGVTNLLAEEQREAASKLLKELSTRDIN